MSFNFSLCPAILLLCAACSRPPTATVAPKIAAPTGAIALAADVSPATAALRRDREAMDEGLRLALADFRDRFKCNAISGCPSQDVLVGFGWTARPYLEQVFGAASAQASYRGRAIRTLAELRDPQALPLLVKTLGDRDPETRAYAIYGVGLLDAREHLVKIQNAALEDDTTYTAPCRLSAWWLLAKWNQPAASARFIELLRTVSQQQMGGPALTWGIELCGRSDAPDCSHLMPAIAQHPAFTVRRAVVHAMASRPVAAYSAALVQLSGDPIGTIARRAEEGLQTISGRSDLHGHSVWASWCLQNHCDQALPTDATPQ